MSFSVEHRAAFRMALGGRADLSRIPWQRWLRIVRRERLASMIADPRLDEIHQTVLARHVVLRHNAARIFEALHRRGVESLPLKGYVLVREIYPRPGMRDMTDIDILVRRDDVPAAACALIELGWTPPPRADLLAPPPRSGSINAMLFRPPGGWPSLMHHVHLHWDVFNSTLPVALALRALPLDEIRAAARPVEHGIRLLDPVHLAVLIAEHAFKHSFHELLMLADLAWVLRRVDRGAVESTARRWGLELPMSAALRLVDDLGGATPGAVRGVRGLDGRWFIHSVLSGRRWNGISGLAYLSMMPGLSGRARFLRELFFPADATVRRYGREPGWGETWRRCRRALSMATSGR